MPMRKALLSSAVLSALITTGSVQAIEFDGFLTAGFSVHDQEAVTGQPPTVYLDGVTDDVSFDNDSKFGLQITADVSEDMQAVAQILAAGADENYDLDVEWAYLDYTLNENFSLRGGKVKEPVFLISDYFEVGYAYPWIRPPQEVYRNNPINTINGMEILMQTNMGGFNLSFQPYLGSNSDAIPGTQGAGTFNAENFFGAALQLAHPSFTFQVSFLNTDVYTSGFVPFSSMLPGFGTNLNDGSVTTNLFNLAASGEAELASAGVSWDVSNFVGYAEYVSRDISGTVSSLFPDQDAYYVTLGYRIGKFLPHITFASSEADTVAVGTNAFEVAASVIQESITLGLRYELNDSAALKMEYQVVDIDFTDPINNQTGLATSFGTTNGVPNVFAGNGLFADGATLTDDTTSIISVAIDVIF